MADAYFYINDEERKKLFDFLQSNQIYLVPDKKYKSPQYEIVKNNAAFSYLIKNVTIRFFAISEKFSKYSLFIERNEFITNEEAYYISQKYGGPYFDIGLYRGYAEDAVIKYKVTWISHLPRFIKLQEQYEEFKATDELKEYFKITIKFLKTFCNKITINNKTYWVSKEVCKELDLK